MSPGTRTNVNAPLLWGFYIVRIRESDPITRSAGLITRSTHRSLLRACEEVIHNSPGTRTILKALGESRVLLVWYELWLKPECPQAGCDIQRLSQELAPRQPKVNTKYIEEQTQKLHRACEEAIVIASTPSPFLSYA